MRIAVLLCALRVVLAWASPLEPRDEANPIIKLGKAGTYMGVAEANGTVVTYNGLPYAEPPLGNLRFSPPRPLPEQSTEVVNATVPSNRCVQFTLAPYGVNNAYLGGGSPGEEDCLKLTVRKPAKAKKGDNLPVMVYIHGGGLIFGSGEFSNFSDWVGQDQGFISVNVNYRLGILGFMNHPSLPSANAGLLDQRMAMRWVKQYITEFGGSSEDLTIMGQSGGGWAIACQMALYDGNTQGLFTKAIPRSVQREPAYTTSELQVRNNALAGVLNCTSAQHQLDCFRNASVPDLVGSFITMSSILGTEGIFEGKVFGYQGSFGPSIDGITLTDSVTRCFRQGKLANVPMLGGSTNDEGFAGYINASQQNPTPQNTTSLDPSTNRILNLTDAQVNEIASFYPVNATFGNTAQGNFFLNVFRAYWMALGLFGEQGILGSERMLGRWMSAKHGPQKVWIYRFNAPTVGTNYGNSTYPLSVVSHSAENSYLDYPLSQMRPFEKAVALEFRAYVSSFIKTGNPNTRKLSTAPTWPNYGALGDFVRSPVRLVPQFAYESNANKSYPTGTEVEVAQGAGIQRTDYWQSIPLLDATRL